MPKTFQKAGAVTDDDMMGDTDTDTDTKPEQPSGPALIDFPERQELEAKLNAAEARLLTLETALSKAEEALLLEKATTANVRNRADRDIEAAHKYGIKKLLEELMPVLDSLEQSLTTVQDTAADADYINSMREGMQLTLQMLQKVLSKFGVKEINPAGELFDPAFHEVIATEVRENTPANTIINVLQKGYQLHDRVIRPARVIIAKALS